MRDKEVSDSSVAGSPFGEGLPICKVALVVQREAPLSAAAAD